MTDRSQQMGLWQSPSGRVHISRRCTSGITPQNARRVWIDEAEWDRRWQINVDNKGAGPGLCRCVQHEAGFRPGTVAKP